MKQRVLMPARRDIFLKSILFRSCVCTSKQVTQLNKRQKKGRQTKSFVAKINKKIECTIVLNKNRPAIFRRPRLQRRYLWETFKNCCVPDFWFFVPVTTTSSGSTFKRCLRSLCLQRKYSSLKIFYVGIPLCAGAGLCFLCLIWIRRIWSADQRFV